MNPMQFFLPLIFILMLCVPVHGEDTWPLVETANRDYQKGHYDKATEGYRKALEQNPFNGHVHYNLANAYLHEGNLGEAIHHYLQAKRFLPRDEDVAANLEYAVRNTQDILDWQRPHPASAILFWVEDWTLQEHLKGLMILNALFWAVLAVRHFSPSPAWSRSARVLGLALMVTLVSSSARWHLESNWNFAVVQVPSLSVVSGKGTNEGVLFRLHEGSIVIPLQRRQDWLEIELADGRKGWVPRNALVS